ncbi:MAG: hypothetical protein AAGD86_11390 [Pseudomonadota bacterium]
MTRTTLSALALCLSACAATGPDGAPDPAQPAPVEAQTATAGDAQAPITPVEENASVALTHAPPDSDAGEASGELICRKMVITGSRMPRNICIPAEESDASAAVRNEQLESLKDSLRTNSR